MQFPVDTKGECKNSKSSASNCLERNETHILSSTTNKSDDAKPHLYKMNSSAKDIYYSDVKVKKLNPRSVTILTAKQIRRKRDTKEAIEEQHNTPKNKTVSGIQYKKNSTSEPVGDFSHQTFDLVNPSADKTNRRIYTSTKKQKSAKKSGKMNKSQKAQKKLKKQNNKNLKESQIKRPKKPKSMYVLSPINSTGKKYKIISTSKLPKLKLQKAQGSSTHQNFKPLIDDSFDYIENIRQKNLNSGKYNSFEFPNLNHENFNFESIEENEEEKNHDSKEDTNQESEGEVPGIIDVHDEPEMDHEYVPVNGAEEEESNAKNNNEVSDSDEEREDYDDSKVNDENNEEETTNSDEDSDTPKNEDDEEGVSANEDEEAEEEHDGQSNNEDKTQVVDEDNENEKVKQREGQLVFPYSNDPITTTPNYLPTTSHSQGRHHHPRSQWQLKYIPTTQYPHIQQERLNYATGSLDSAKQAFMQHPVTGSGNTKGFNHDFKPVRGSNYVKGLPVVQPPNRFQTVGYFNKNLIRKPMVTPAGGSRPKTKINLSGYGGYKPHVAPLVSTVMPLNDYAGSYQQANPEKEETTLKQQINDDEEDYYDMRKPKENSDSGEEEEEEGNNREHGEVEEEQEDYDNKTYDENIDHNENPQPIPNTQYYPNSNLQHYDMHHPSSVSSIRPFSSEENSDQFRIQPTQNNDNQRVPFQQTTINGRPFDNRPISNLPHTASQYQYKSNPHHFHNPAVSYYEERRPFMSGERPLITGRFKPFLRQPHTDLSLLHHQKIKYNTTHNSNNEDYDYSYPQPLINKDYGNYDEAVPNTNFNNMQKPLTNEGLINGNLHFDENNYYENKPQSIINPYDSGEIINHDQYRPQVNNEQIPLKSSLLTNSQKIPVINYQNVRIGKNPSFPVSQVIKNEHFPSNIHTNNKNNFYNDQRFQFSRENNPLPRSNAPQDLNYTSETMTNPSLVYNTERVKMLPDHEFIPDHPDRYPYHIYQNGRINEPHIDPRNENKHGDKQILPFQEKNINNEMMHRELRQYPQYRGVNSNIDSSKNPSAIHSIDDNYSFSTKPRHLHSSQTNLSNQRKINSENERKQSDTAQKSYKIDRLQHSNPNILVNQRINPKLRTHHQTNHEAIRNHQNNNENGRNNYPDVIRTRYERPDHPGNDEYLKMNDAKYGKYNENNKEQFTQVETDDDNDNKNDNSQKIKNTEELENKDPERIQLSKKSLVKTLNEILDKKDAISRVKEIDEHKDKPKSYSNYWVLEYSMPTKK